MTMEFYESFMKFSFADEDVFCIENDPLVTEAEGVKTCECVVLINPRVALIEAKSSSPKEISGDQFKNFISEIKQKFSDSLLLFNEIKNKKHGEAAFLRLPFHLQNMTIAPNQYIVCLIIHGHRLEWLVGLQDAFREAMREVVNQWNIKDSQVKVFNEETALENRLIVAFIPKNERDVVREKDSISQEKIKNWFAEHKVDA